MTEQLRNENDSEHKAFLEARESLVRACIFTTRVILFSNLLRQMLIFWDYFLLDYFQ